MLELTFVIVIIGILSAIAIPRFAATRDDATVTKARTTVSSVRNAVAAERQKRILRGDFTRPIVDLALTNGYNQPIFDFYDGNNTAGNEVLSYPLRSCMAAGAEGCWVSNADTTYSYVMPGGSQTVPFILNNNIFTCSTTGATGAECRLLTE